MFKLAIVAACALAAAPIARAGPDEDAQLAQVKQLASKDQDAQTAALVSQYVDQHHDLISSILKMYMGYLNQIQGMTASDGTGQPGNPQAPPAGTGPTMGNAANPASSGPQTTGSQQSTGLQMSELQPATGLQTGTLQPSTGLQPAEGLQTSHLPGYPSLPDTAPASSITNPTEAQLEYAAKVQKEMQDRKQVLMSLPAPAGSPY